MIGSLKKLLRLSRDDTQRFVNEGAPAQAAVVEPVPLNYGTRTAMIVQNVWKVFAPERRGGEPVRAVRGLDLTVYDGEITCLLGPNGAGKSTFLSLLMGLARPTAGSIRVLGHVCKYNTIKCTPNVFQSCLTSRVIHIKTHFRIKS